MQYRRLEIKYGSANLQRQRSKYIPGAGRQLPFIVQVCGSMLVCADTCSNLPQPLSCCTATSPSRSACERLVRLTSLTMCLSDDRRPLLPSASAPRRHHVSAHLYLNTQQADLQGRIRKMNLEGANSGGLGDRSPPEADDFSQLKVYLDMLWTDLVTCGILGGYGPFGPP